MRVSAVKRWPAANSVTSPNSPKGVVPHDTDDPVPYLHSVAAFVVQRYPARLVL
jgi:hypothetical protein